MSRSASSPSAPWRSLLSLALIAPTPIVLLIQNFTNFTYTLHVSFALLFWLVSLGLVLSFAAVTLAYKGLAFDPRPLAAFAYTIGSICLMLYIPMWFFLFMYSVRSHFAS